MKEGGPLPYAYVNNGSIWYWGTGNCFVLSGSVLTSLACCDRNNPTCRLEGTRRSAWGRSRSAHLLEQEAHRPYRSPEYNGVSVHLVLINCLSINNCACITKNIFYSMDVRFNAYSPYEHIDPILKPNFHDVKNLTSWAQCFLDSFAELLTRVPLISQCRWKAS